MSFIGDVTGVGKIAEVVGTVIDKIWPDKTRADEAKARVAEMVHNGELQRYLAEVGLIQGQIAINKVEAASSSRFVAGWRPFIGWVCGAGLAWEFVLQPVASWCLAVSGYATALPDLHSDALIPLLLALLGVGTMRTIEKIQGVAR